MAIFNAFTDVISSVLGSIGTQNGKVSSELEEARRAQEYWASLGVDIGMNQIIRTVPSVSFIIDETVHGFVPISASQFKVSSKMLIKKSELLDSLPSLKKCMRALIQAIKGLTPDTYMKLIDMSNDQPSKMLERIITEFDSICAAHDVKSRTNDERRLSDLLFERALRRFGGFMGIMNMCTDILNYIATESTEPMEFNKCYSCKNARAERFTATKAEMGRKCTLSCRPVPEYLTARDIMKLYADVTISNGILVSDYVPLPIASCQDYITR